MRAAALVLAALTLHAAHAQDSTGVVYGTVTDARFGDPLPGATVEIAGRRAASDSDGRYAFAGIPRGRIQLRADFVGYSSLVVVAELQSDSVRVDLALQEPPCGWENAATILVRERGLLIRERGRSGDGYSPLHDGGIQRDYLTESYLARGVSWSRGADHLGRWALTSAGEAAPSTYVDGLPVLSLSGVPLLMVDHADVHSRYVPARFGGAAGAVDVAVSPIVSWAEGGAGVGSVPGSEGAGARASGAVGSGGWDPDECIATTSAALSYQAAASVLPNAGMGRLAAEYVPRVGGAVDFAVQSRLGAASSPLGREATVGGNVRTTKRGDQAALEAGANAEVLWRADSAGTTGHGSHLGVRVEARHERGGASVGLEGYRRVVAEHGRSALAGYVEAAPLAEHRTQVGSVDLELGARVERFGLDGSQVAWAVQPRARATLSNDSDEVRMYAYGGRTASQIGRTPHRRDELGVGVLLDPSIGPVAVEGYTNVVHGSGRAFGIDAAWTGRRWRLRSRVEWGSARARSRVKAEYRRYVSRWRLQERLQEMLAGTYEVGLDLGEGVGGRPVMEIRASFAPTALFYRGRTEVQVRGVVAGSDRVPCVEDPRVACPVSDIAALLRFDL